MPYNPTYNAPLSPIPRAPPSAFLPASPPPSPYQIPRSIQRESDTSLSNESTSSNLRASSSVTSPSPSSTTRSFFSESSEFENHIQNRQRIVLKLIDLGGNEAYMALWPDGARNAGAVMICYDVGDRKSFDAVWKIWRKIWEARNNHPPDIHQKHHNELISDKLAMNGGKLGIPAVLVGCMVDTLNMRFRQFNLYIFLNFNF